MIFKATPLVGATYSVKSNIAAGPSDTETGSHNSSTGNLTVSRVAGSVNVTKEIVAGATPVNSNPNSPKAYTGAWGTDVVYKLTFTNNSSIALPISMMGDSWTDTEQVTTAAQARYASATTVPGGAGHQACESTDPGFVCPTVTANSQAAPQYYVSPLTIAQAPGATLAAGQSVSIYYTRNYAPPVCGSSQIQNLTVWNSNTNGQSIFTVTGPNSFQTLLNLPPVVPPTGSCTGVAVTPKVAKTLDHVEDINGNVQPLAANGHPIIRQDGDSAIFKLTFIGDPNENLVFRVYDQYRNLNAPYAVSTFKNGTVNYDFIVDKCDIAAGDTTSTCPNKAWAGPYPKTVASKVASWYYSDQTNMPEVVVGAGKEVTVWVRAKYHVTGNVCRAVFDDWNNILNGLVVPDATPGKIFTGNLQPTANTRNTPLELLSNAPQCVDLTTNKTMSQSQLTFGQPFSFFLDFTNATSLNTGIANPSNNAQEQAVLAGVNPLTNLQITDALGAHFVATGVSCATTSGTATPPAVSLANITGPDNTFSATIPSMDDKSVIRCTVTGSAAYAGSYNNTASISVNQADTAKWFEVSPTNNSANVNYGVLGPMVSLTKKLSPTPAFTPGGPLTFVITATSAGVVPADGTVVTDNFPAELQSPSWTCTAAGGAVCPNANGTTTLNETIATFPAGGSVTYTVTGTVAASAISVTNSATALPPTGGSCVLNGKTSAPPCLASDTGGAGATAPYVTVSKTGGGTVTAGNAATFSIVATAVGAHAANGTLVSDPVATNFASQTWTCTASGGAVCPNANGSGAIQETIATFPAGATLTYQVTATEPPRLLRRLFSLRGLSYEEVEQVLARSP